MIGRGASEAPRDGVHDAGRWLGDPDVRLAIADAGEGFDVMSFAGSEFQTAAAPRIAARASQAIRAAWAHYLSRRLRWRELCELRAMDDMSLKDIGITRLDIGAAIRSGVDVDSARH
jgi:uncharacterized protein YjiS (DUF1127 family)